MGGAGAQAKRGATAMLIATCVREGEALSLIRGQLRIGAKSCAKRQPPSKPSQNMLGSFKIARHGLKITFERDSVCAGDDVLAPNRIEQSFDENAVWKDVLANAIVHKYLPSVSRSKTYWSVLCEGQKVADVGHSTVAHVGVSVQLLNPHGVVNVNKIFFRYLKQEPVR